MSAKHRATTNAASAAEDGESTTFLFTSESVGEGHPGERPCLLVGECRRICRGTGEGI